MKIPTEVAAAVAEPKKKAKPPTQILFGRCRDEDANHAACRGAIRQGRPPVVITCSCPNHEGEPPKCIDCGGVGVVDSVTRTCTDVEGCLEAVRAKQRDNPLHQMLQEAVVAGQATRAAKKAPAGSSTPRPPRANGSAPRSKEGRCQHCGDPTKGGLFAPGHDAKLKGQLAKVVEDVQGTRKADRVVAAAEMIARGWVKKALPDDLLADATAMVEKAKSPAEFAAKVAAKRIPAQ